MEVNHPSLVRSALASGQPHWDLEFDWHLTNRCNFDCEYCHPQIKHVLNRKNLEEPDWQHVVQQFDQLGRTSLIHMSGGEPFMYPNFVDLCRELTRHHYISINTNLTHHDLGRFMEEVDPKRVIKIAAAMHIQERERHNIDPTQFISDVEELGNRGFPVSALYIMYPPLFGRAEKDIMAMHRHESVDVQAKVFKGVYEGRRYPESYSSEEQQLIHQLSGSYKFNVPYLSRPLTFQGQPCFAGATSFKVTVTGDVRRCASVATSYGNLYDGTFSPALSDAPCPARRILVMSQCASYLTNGLPA